jgi:hypothetical protein
MDLMPALLRPVPPEAPAPTFDGKTVEGSAMLNLTAHVRQCYSEAQSAKTEITRRLLTCQRQRRGEYEPDKAAQIRATGGSDIYMMLTDIKCRAAESWIKDVLMNAQDKPWSMRPTPIPDLPPEMKADIVEHLVQEAMQAQQMTGIPLQSDAISARMDELMQEVNEALMKKAKEASDNMERKMADILTESNFDDVYAEVINDFCTYPTAFLKGPVVKKRKGLKWGPNFTPEVTDEIGRGFYRVSPFDAFPCPNATGVNDEYFIERIRLNRKTLQGMIGMPGNNDGQIKQVLDLYGRNGLKFWRDGDSETERLDGKHGTYHSRGIIEGFEYWGAVSGQMLQEWGMKNVDPYKDYEANVWVVGPFTIRCVLNSDPLGRRPYEAASFVKNPGSIWGQALPELMSDVQTMCNAAARALANNMSISSGPQVEVDVSRLPAGAAVTSMYPWKIWQTTSSAANGNSPAIRFFQPDMNAESLLGILQQFTRMADEVTGVPNYIYGSSAVSGAGRTASGLSMLMENAAKGIKHAILSLDRGVSGMLRRLFEHLMIYDPDPSIKGDMDLVPSGVVATIIKDNVQLRRQEFLQATSNPIDIQILGIEGRAELLRQLAKGLDMDVNDIIPSAAALKQKQLAMAQMAQMQAAQAGAPGGALPPPGGAPQQQPPAPQGLPNASPAG